MFTQSYSDPTWISTSLIICTIAEPGAYLIAVCLLTFRPLLVYTFYDSPLSSYMRRLFSSKTPCSQPPDATFIYAIPLPKLKRQPYDIELQECASDEDTIIDQERNTDKASEGVVLSLPSQ